MLLLLILLLSKGDVVDFIYICVLDYINVYICNLALHTLAALLVPIPDSSPQPSPTLSSLPTLLSCKHSCMSDSRTGNHSRLANLSHQEPCFTCFEGCVVGHIAHDVPLVDQVQTVANSCTLPEAVGPQNSAALQCPKVALHNRQHALQFWLHAHRLGKALTKARLQS